MSMLGEQIKELREAARNIQGKLGRCLYGRKDVDEMQQVRGMLFEAADTIEGLRDRLQATVETCHWEYPQGVSGWRGYCECSACGYRLYEGNGINEKEWTYCPNCRREFKEVDA